ncbi:MAG: tRNA guanosine(15) transglycosylase TgtA, partial [Euryarchaeota archaeon]|nr:tRNA guanosine(15) transglycosylase TgtA [Euryarchaeota archaeon]
MFEIKHRDAMGRIGIMEVKGKRIETPLILPVINPRLQSISAREIEKIGFKSIITNSYIIYKNEELRELAVERGIHKMLGFGGLIMTDSGAYQLFEYGRVSVGAREIVEFQNSIGSDIGVMLDIPTPPDASYEKAEKDLNETLKRARESVEIPRKMPLAGTLQGSTHLKLREKSAREIGKLGFDVFAIGGVVPLMESYRFSELVRIIMHSKKFLPLNKPVHLFGCGHPMLFALAVANGCDIFDSAAYSLYAKDDRYVTAEGTLRLEDIYEFPCSCEVCSTYEPKEISSLDKKERETLLARHNLHAMLQEIRRVKQSIYEGSLWELVEKRARNHPYVLSALRTVLEYDLEKFDPVTKNSAFFYSGPESLRRPEVLRHLKKLNEIKFRAEKLVLLPEAEKPYARTYDIESSEDYHVCIASSVFGVIPLEIEEVYPLNQHEAPEPEKAQVEFMKTRVKKYSKNFERIFVHKSLKFLKGEVFEDLDMFRREGNIKIKMQAIADYQFGRGVGEVLFEDVRAEVAITGRIRRVYSGGVLLATLRAQDGFLILTPEGAKKLLRLPYPRNRVVVNKDAEEFVKEGKSVFAKFV